MGGGPVQVSAQWAGAGGRAAVAAVSRRGRTRPAVLAALEPATLDVVGPGGVLYMFTIE